MGNNRKVYEIKGKSYDRVTTVLGETSPTQHLNRWYAKLEREALAVLADKSPLLAEHIRALTTYAADDYKNAKADLGSNIHNAIDCYFKGFPLVTPLVPEEALKFEQFKRWLEVSKFKIIEAEQTVYSESLGVAGTLDLYGETEAGKWIIDIKTGGVYYDAAVQVATYAMLKDQTEEENDPVPGMIHFPNCGILKLEVDDYALLVVEDPASYAEDFIRRLGSYRLKKKAKPFRQIFPTKDAEPIKGRA